jgi:hypothetical protein
MPLNLSACNSRERRGYWLEGRASRLQDRGDVQVAYTHMMIEREAIMGAFNFSDLHQSCDVSQHRLEFFYQAHKNIHLGFTGLFGLPLNRGTSTPPEPLLKRLQFDVILKFYLSPLLVSGRARIFSPSARNRHLGQLAVQSNLTTLFSLRCEQRR